MSTRYTRRDAILAFGRLAAALGKTVGHYEETPDGSGNMAQGRYRTIPGGWTLDYSATYGGVVVEELSSEPNGTGVSHPLGESRRSPREFCSAVNLALRALDLAQAGSTVSA